MSRWRSALRPDNPWWFRGGLVLIVLIGAVLRVHEAGRTLKSFDEFGATYVAAGGRLAAFDAFMNHGAFTNHDVFDPALTAVLRTTSVIEQGNAQLYTLLLHRWIRLVGTGDVETRLLSVVLGIATIGLTAWVARAMTASPTVGLLAAFLLALHPLHVHFSAITRGYALGTFLVALSSALFLGLVGPRSTPRPWHYVAYVLATLAALFTHYFTAYALGVHMVYALARLRERCRWAGLAVAWACIVVAFGSWFWVGPGAEGLAQMAKHNQYWMDLARRGIGTTRPATPSVIGQRLVQQYIELSGIDVYWGLLSEGVRVRYLLPLLVSPLLLAAVAVLRGASSRTVPEEPRSWLPPLLVVAPFVFAAAAAVSSGHTVAFQIQYSTFTLPFLAILLAVPFAPPRDRWRWPATLALGLVLAYMTASLAHPRFPATHNPLPEMSRRIESLYRPGDTVVYPSWDVAWINTLYLKSETPIRQRTERLGRDHIVLRRPDGADTLIYDLATSGLPRPMFW